MPGSGQGAVLAGPSPRPVAFAFQEQVVTGVDDPVEYRLADHRVGEQRVPVNWNWLRFAIAYLPFQMGICATGVSA
jgi:hypothetical protein